MIRNERFELTRLAASAFVAALFVSTAMAQRFPFVISGDDSTPTATDFSSLSLGPAGNDGFNRVRDGHFYNDVGRLRMWGVNVGYGACFPSHVDAEKVAAHLAKQGINAIRIHHHESQFSPTGLLHEDGTFDPEQVDRLDYFLAQLHKRGIYANLNLHVGRVASEHLGIPTIGNSFDTGEDKHALHFQPQIQSAFREYCREYLTHVNPYRKLRRVDDPAIAMIEMCNENSFARAGSSIIRSAPEPYRTDIRRLWNQWLQRRYPGQTAEQAWGISDSQPVSLVADSSEWASKTEGGWQVVNADKSSPLRIESRVDGIQPTVRLVSSANVRESWHQQFASDPVSLLSPNDCYTLSFECRSDEARSADVQVSATEEKSWQPLGLVQSFDTTPEWSKFVYRFRSPRKLKDTARIAFSVGGSDVALEVKNLVFKTGNGDWALPDGQSFASGNVDLPSESWPPNGNDDVRQFMIDTERDFYSGMKMFLKDELGVRVPILTTQIDYQELATSTSVSDYQDMHVYWHHPEFPEKDWDPAIWNVQSETLLAFPFQNNWPRVNLTMRAGWRVHRQPFTISEWNTGEPSFYSADAIPIAAIMASLQDWDAVFFFDYHNRRDLWNSDHIQNFFEINGQPCKKALLGPMANLFRRGDLAPLQDSVVSSYGKHESLGPLSLRYRIGIQRGLENGEMDKSLEVQVEKAIQERLLVTPTESVRWDARENSKAFATINTPRSKCVWGLVGGRPIHVGSWQFDFRSTQLDYAVLTATSRDEKPLSESDCVLLVALANAENTDMQWNEDRTSVGAHWGNGPTMVNGIPVQVTIPAGNRAKKLYALDATGKRRHEVTARPNEDGSTSFSLGPEHKTLFYELSSK